MKYREVEVEGRRRMYRRIELPTIVCLCGSTRFYPAFQEANYRETMAGNIVLTVGFYPHAQEQMHGEDKGCTPEEKEALDKLHLKKIDLADEVLVLNVGGYVGSSTMSEIAYATWRHKTLRWLEEPKGGTEAWLMEHRHVLGKLIARHANIIKPGSEDKTFTLNADIEGLGKVGDEVTLLELAEWGAARGFEIGLHRPEQYEE